MASEAFSTTSEESALKDFPDLKELLSRGTFLVYPQDNFMRHPIKSAEKKLLYKGKWKKMNKGFKWHPVRQRLIIKNLDQTEVLSMTRQLDITEEEWKKKDMVVTAAPNTRFGRIIKDNRCMYEVFDHNDQLIYHVEKLVNKLPENEYSTIMKPDGTEIGRIGDNTGLKTKLSVPHNMPLTHKALLLGLTISKQERADHVRERLG